MPYGKSASPQEALTFLEQHPAVRAIDVLLADSSGVLRGKRVEREGLAAVYHQGFSLPGSMFALDIQGGTIQATGLGFDEGDADRPCLPIPGSLVATPWLGEGVAQVQVAMVETDGVTPFYADCRHVLQSILYRFAAKGLKPVVAVELEFYLVDKERAASGHAQPPRSPRTGRREYRTQINAMADLDDWSVFLEEVDRVAAIQNVPATGSLTEYGPGQMEVNLQHGDCPLRACDEAIRLKRLIKGVALNHGAEATFLAKPYADMAGSGTHLHVSVLDTTGNNVFASEAPDGTPALHHAIGGLLETMADGMAIFAPNANSYRRFRRESYVPLQPSWGVNNRGVAVRIPHSDAANRRLEHRVAGADANPYLVMAYVLAGMLHGLEQQIQPGKRTDGNACRDERPELALPHHWPVAIDRFARSAFVRNTFGERCQRLHAITREGEMDDYYSQVPALDHTWYLQPL